MKTDMSTSSLARVLKSLTPLRAGEYLDGCRDELAEDEQAFGRYMRSAFRAHGYTQQEAFLRADIPERYGYKLLRGEKRTRRRDVILRLCFAARLPLAELQRALKLYGMPALYERLPRDAVLIIAANTGVGDVQAVNELLHRHGFAALAPCGSTE